MTDYLATVGCALAFTAAGLVAVLWPRGRDV
jgi:hypothetical protein